MKVCLGCKQKKTFDDFYKNKKNHDGHARYCKSCVRIQTRISNQKNPLKYSENKRRARQNLKLKIQLWKQEKGCSRCPENHPAALDLHHIIPSDKSFEPSRAWGYTKFLKEAAKCIVLCANCHRKEHFGGG